jgi:sulfate adenylyltransferase subunit 1
VPSATHPQTAAFSIDRFLEVERGKDLLRFSTMGSVDDGKSTLIGRLLYDTGSVFEDHLQSIEGKGTAAPGALDFALLTDGLRAEREQAITIDVAYRYFSTARRKFMIADTPGHEQYTRNMATGASTASAVVMLVDARKGALPQSLHHAFIASLLGVRHVLVAVNKMDLMDYREEPFRLIEREMERMLRLASLQTGNPVEPCCVPVSALVGDNIVLRSRAMPWYSGLSVLEWLESVPANEPVRDPIFRLPVQRVVRPNESFRGFAGQIASGTVRPGDRVTALPSGLTARVARIVTYDGDLDTACAPLSVTLVLDSELDISRGDLLASGDDAATVAAGCQASIIWMDKRPLSMGRSYMLKHATQQVPAVVQSLDCCNNTTTMTREPATTLEMNGIGEATIHFLRPVSLDLYSRNRAIGSFILIDPETNSTSAAGMVRSIVPGGPASKGLPHWDLGRVTNDERARRWGHRGGVLSLSATAAQIDRIERLLFASGAITIRCSNREQAEWVAASGVLALLLTADEAATLTVEYDDRKLTTNIDSPEQIVEAVRRFLACAEPG